MPEVAASIARLIVHRGDVLVSVQVGMLLTFGYGSNMCFGRMHLRVESLAFVAVGVLPAFRFVLNKLSKDGSAKGNITPAHGARVFGVVYSLDDADLEALNRSEGLGDGYILRDNLDVQNLDGDRWDQPVLVYVADPRYVVEDVWPYGWYKRHILDGARHHGLPAEYVDWVASHPEAVDPDRRRDAQERMFPCDRELTEGELAGIRATRRQSPDRLTDYSAPFRRLTASLTKNRTSPQSGRGN